MRWRNVLFGFIILLLVVGAVVVNQTGDEETAGQEEQQSTEPIQPDRDVKPQEGFAAPDFELETLAGDTVRLYENNGKPSLINFWASWCPPCKVEMPHLQEAYDQYGDDVNFHMVDLAFNDNFDNMTQYIEENNYTFPVPLDETGDVAMTYQAAAIPTTFIVDAEGIITHRIQGAMTEQQIQAIMDDLTD
ncbi:hypothetical protein B0W44_15485 [Novibacillus thermophilus]|uniref:Thioredoxin domain-containing protein n=2 Tax=Novibacillus thermophilus TaxID=1471761 RepID=A0A1U9KC54_9BACL|nr:hypothetical protein B0W44_15485 [Novibacillus thermophilus]